ncbi:type 2 phosphatidylinositol 4,5-bisphosphate 4-phosphatase-like [Watersipora subatra]|uniref:type 2 phosphatidylinositol 4,5-bisphosphate 4-phosphatase-like n=1 Tax=Watersipora subatra TaxID=2589382 RepID=UPI00355BDDD2
MAENQPLLASNGEPLSAPPPTYTEVDLNKSNDSDESVRQQELPPPYTPSSLPQITHINCKVCQAHISLQGSSHLYVVKCTQCNEATPIKNAPPGKKYIRCPCNCLLMCSVGAVRIACPRENCRRMIGLQPQATHFGAASHIIGPTVRVRCFHCEHIFVFLKQNVKHKLAICPRCGVRSSVGREFIKRKTLLFGLIGIFFLLLGVITTVVAMETNNGVGVYIIWIGAYIVGLLNILRAILFCRVNVSEPLD